MSHPLRLLINGSRGRMGQALVQCAATIPELTVSAEVDAGDDFAAGLQRSEAVIDFSHQSRSGLFIILGLYINEVNIYNIKIFKNYNLSEKNIRLIPQR